MDQRFSFPVQQDKGNVGSGSNIAVLVERKACCHVSNAFLGRLELIWPISPKRPKTETETATGWPQPLNRGGHLIQVTNKMFV